MSYEVVGRYSQPIDLGLNAGFAVGVASITFLTAIAPIGCGPDLRSSWGEALVGAQPVAIYACVPANDKRDASHGHIDPSSTSTYPGRTVVLI